jgi:hypothetical protein
MPASPGLNNTWRRIVRYSRRARKGLYQRLRHRGGTEKAVLFIVGCQRSGTTLMTQIFERDLNAKVYGEFSSLSSLDSVHRIRLNPLPDVRLQIRRDRASMVVLKPLVETQNTLTLLDCFPTARALWMFRDYRKVLSSNLSLFGINNGINNLRPIVNNEPHNWRSENVSAETRAMVLQHFAEDMDPFDAAALFWIVRNRLFFELGLDRNEAVSMCRYDDLVANPGAVMRRIYDFAGSKYPSDTIIADVRPDRNTTANSITLSPRIESMCDDLLQQLNAAYERQHGS